MMTEQDWERLARFVSGESSPAERAEVERWAAGNADRKAILASVERRWAAAASRHGHSVDAAWTHLAAKLSNSFVALDDDDIVPLAPTRARWSTAARVLPLAAAIVVAVGLVSIWRSGPDTDNSASSLGTGTAAAPESRTGIGERLVLDLPDGSQISLGARTTVRLGERYAQGERHVYLDGQAHFRVQHDSSRPFVVHAAGTVSEDLGTEFDVRAYPGDTIVRVVVSEGVVAVRRDGTAAGAGVTLRRGDVARVAGEAAPVVLHDQNVERLMAWQSGEIVFDNTPLSEVARELERWFDIEVRIADTSIVSRPLTARYRSDSLDDLLSAIGMSTEVKAQRQGRLVTLTRGAAPRASDAQPP